MATQRSCAVEARGLVKLYANTPALLGVDLRVPYATVCALVGPNGAGKSTLLRIISTAVRATSGSARVHGLDVVAEASAVRGLVDVMPAKPAYYPELSGEENLSFVLSMRGRPERLGEIAAALDHVDLGKVARDPVRTYSSGMLRRLCIARLLLTRPAVALLDEPYGALDEEGRDLVDELLTQARGQGRTAIVITHEQERIAALASLRVELRHGGIADPVTRSAASILHATAPR